MHHTHRLELVVGQEKDGSPLAAGRPKCRRDRGAITILSPGVDHRPSGWVCQLSHQPPLKLRDCRDKIVGQSP